MRVYASTSSLLHSIRESTLMVRLIDIAPKIETIDVQARPLPCTASRQMEGAPAWPIPRIAHA
jgi:hypothetical protein